jgi:hypothetical protein
VSLQIRTRSLADGEIVKLDPILIRESRSQRSPYGSSVVQEFSPATIATRAVPSSRLHFEVASSFARQ